MSPGRGRPKKTIDWVKVDQMLMAQCDGTDIAQMLGVHPNVLYEACKAEHKCNFSEYSQQKKAKGVTFAKTVFFDEAFVNPEIDAKAKTTKQIFWLKNCAGWAEKQEVKQDLNATIQDVRFELPDNKSSSPELAPLPPGWDEQI